jgi:hypothetical protein
VLQKKTAKAATQAPTTAKALKRKAAATNRKSKRQKSDQDEPSLSTSTSYVTKSGYVWQKEPPPPKVVDLALPKKPTILEPVSQFDSMVGFFSFFMDDNLLSTIVQYTNTVLEEDEQTSIIEIRAFIGILILLGLVKKADVEIAEIWSYESIHFVEWISVCMPRERFKQLATSLTFYDEAIEKQHINDKKRMFKINEIFKPFQKKLEMCLDPGSRLCVDEQLYAFRGNCNFRQYIPSKPARYGLKYWSISDVGTSYVLKTDLYIGKSSVDDENVVNVVNQDDEDDDEDEDELVGLEKSEAVVYKLARSYPNRSVTADCYFSPNTIILRFFALR